MISLKHKTLSAFVVGVLLVGCSLLGGQRASAPESLPVIHEAAYLHPALSRLAVVAMGSTHARIAWRSPWRGVSHVLYGTESPLRAPYKLQCSVGIHGQADLPALKPGTRYFFKVETRGPMGTACSATCSFLTPS